MSRLPFHIVDVFAETRYQGNQLAVFRVPGSIPDEEMLNITREMNYSESTFIEKEDPEKKIYTVRIFTKVMETPFAGHPTLGTAYVIQQTTLGEPVPEITLDLKAGMIPVRFSYQGGEPDILWMEQLEPEFGMKYRVEEFARFLNLKPEDFDQGYPIQEVSTGFPFFIVPLKTRSALERATLDKTSFLKFIEDTESKAPIIFCPEPRNPENHLACRMFATYFGIEEDPATGSANGCLAGYLAKHRYFDSPKVDIKVEQGYEMGRPSMLYLRSEDTDHGIDVQVGGKVVMIAEGEFV
jgi:trans-2,3-dihydro-3-hydroxyanthranilate isomerase